MLTSWNTRRDRINGDEVSSWQSLLAPEGPSEFSGGSPKVKSGPWPLWSPLLRCSCPTVISDILKGRGVRVPAPESGRADPLPKLAEENYAPLVKGAAWKICIYIFCAMLFPNAPAIFNCFHIACNELGSIWKRWKEGQNLENIQSNASISHCREVEIIVFVSWADQNTLEKSEGKG